MASEPKPRVWRLNDAAVVDYGHQTYIRRVIAITENGRAMVLVWPNTLLVEPSHVSVRWPCVGRFVRGWLWGWRLVGWEEDCGKP